MRMKQVCDATLLTERAIRLYISKGLVSPAQRQGLLDFEKQDIEILRNIFTLRQHGFSLEQIDDMQQRPECIEQVLQDRLADAKARLERESDTAEALERLGTTCPQSILALGELLRSSRVPRAAPDFSHFDEDAPQDRQRMTEFALEDLEQMKQKRKRKIRWIVLAATVVFLGFFFWGAWVMKQSPSNSGHPGLQGVLQDILQISEPGK